MATWWRPNDQVGRQKLRCKHCVTHPELVSTGLSEPKSLECPVCHDLHYPNGEKFDQEEYDRRERADSGQKAEDIWRAIWGEEEEEDMYGFPTFFPKYLRGDDDEKT